MTYLWKEGSIKGEGKWGRNVFSKFSLLLLEPKSNQTDEGAHGYQKQLESVTASAHLRITNLIVTFEAQK